MNWSPYTKSVQGGIPDGDYATGQHILLMAGPPRMSAFGGPANLGAGVVYPIGFLQNFAWSQNRMFSRIFELGSDETYVIAGRAVGQITISRIYYHGPSLLRCLWGYYSDAPVGSGESPHIESLYGFTPDQGWGGFPFKAGSSVGGGPAKFDHLKDIKLPPGYDNFYLNLASDLFSQPVGLLMVLADNNEQWLAGGYFEQCVVPSYSIATDAQSIIMQEQVGIQYGKVVPLKMNTVALLRGVIEGDVAEPGLFQNIL